MTVLVTMSDHSPGIAQPTGSILHDHDLVGQSVGSTSCPARLPIAEAGANRDRRAKAKEFRQITLRPAKSCGPASFYRPLSVLERCNTTAQGRPPGMIETQKKAPAMDLGRRAEACSGWCFCP